MLKDLIRPYFLSALQLRARVDMRLARPKAHGLPFPVVVSLTSYWKRFDTLAPTLRSLLAQDVRADATVLWVAAADMDKLPPEVRALERKGLLIREVADLRSYKKIIPALEAYPNAAILTADDDVYYPKSWLRLICEAWSPDAREVLCHRAHRMKREGEGFAPYESWDFEVTDNGPSPNLFATGVGGIFYPPGIFHPDVMHVDRLMELCPTTDDVWLNWMARLNGATVRKVGPKQRFHEWPGTQTAALQNQNFVEGSNNDRQLDNIVRAYGIPESIR